MSQKKILVIIQARIESKRFPRKVLSKINGQFSITFQVDRIKKSKKVNKIVVAIPNNFENKYLGDQLSEHGINVFSGSSENVFQRYCDCIKSEIDCQIILRITGDCPFSDPILIDSMIKIFLDGKHDYLTTGNSFPDGVDIEIFTRELFISTIKLPKNRFDLEHVTPTLKRIAVNPKTVECEENFENVRITLDEAEDYKLIQALEKEFGNLKNLSWKVLAMKILDTERLSNINSMIARNEGSKISTGQKIWKRALRVIPTGNHLLSKNPNYILPNLWPTYYSKARGVHIWDLDGKKFLDMAYMGVGTNSLGYQNKFVDSRVIESIKKGNLSSFNSLDEVLLAEKLLEISPHFSKVRFARTGGEANAIAIRIARASTGKDEIALCGYHGWHDWYLSANLNSKNNLDELLMQGLLPRGVPKNLLNTTKIFRYGDIGEFEKSLSKNTAAVIMEFTRSKEPDLNFLNYVRKRTIELGIVLIFDECSTGFRENLGGMHQNYGINPDMVMYGKALGNGYAITAVLGIDNIMDAAETTFISSTFWTERIGFTAGLATLEEMERTKSWQALRKNGKEMQQIWTDLAKRHNLEITIAGYYAISSFTFQDPDHLIFKTFLTQEMLKNSILGSTIFYSCTEHHSSHLSSYSDSLDRIFKSISRYLDSNRTVQLLDSSPARVGFGRLN